MNQAASFTIHSDGILRVLKTPVAIGPAFHPETTRPLFKRYVAIWDTGATASVISQKVIHECGLKPISMIEAHGADGKYVTEVFLVSMALPNKAEVASLRVSRGKLRDADILVGMDIIGRGDFAVTNFEGKTSFSFRQPSCERIDFTR